MGTVSLFADIPDGTTVFIDANPFVYHFIFDPTCGTACTSLLERIERQEIEGFCTPHVLAEVAHRLMTLEACWTFGWSYQGIASRLRQHPNELSQLQTFRQSLLAISQLGLTITAVTDSHVIRAASLSQASGLMTNDAIIAIVMQDHAVTAMASRDTDFDRLPFVTRYAPV